MNSSIINQLQFEAEKSSIEHQLAAGIIKSNKLISKPYRNSTHTILKYVNTGSLHAEAHAILKYFGKSFYFDNKKNLVYFPNNNYKRKKIDLIVIRINKNKEICNARPCYNCLNMMKCVGINRVYYSISSNTTFCSIIPLGIFIPNALASLYQFVLSSGPHILHLLLHVLLSAKSK